MILVDFHPMPSKALVDGPQALLLEELPWFLEDVAIARAAYEKRQQVSQRSVNDMPNGNKKAFSMRGNRVLNFF